MLDNNYFDFNRIPYFICIGTSRNKIDMIAPCVGTILDRCGFNVIGTEDYNLHAMNLKERLNEIDNINPLMYQKIAVDACMCNSRVHTSNIPMKPGNGLGKILPIVGETSIRLNINSDKDADTQLHLLMNEHLEFEDETRIMAAEIAHEILRIYNYPYGRNNKRLRSLHNAKLVLQGETFRNIAKFEDYSKSTVQNDIKRLRDINIHLYNACRIVLEENVKDMHLRGGNTTKKKYEAIRDEKTRKQSRRDNNSNPVVIFDDSILE